MIRKYLERNGKIKFEKDFVNEIEVIRMKCSDYFWINEMNIIEWLLMVIMDRCSGFYGYRITICCGN